MIAALRFLAGGKEYLFLYVSGREGGGEEALQESVCAVWADPHGQKRQLLLQSLAGAQKGISNRNPKIMSQVQ